MVPDDPKPSDERPDAVAPATGSLADTTAELHEEGKALDDQSKDLAEVLSEKLSRGGGDE